MLLGQTWRKFRSEVKTPANGVTFLSRFVVPVDPHTRQLHGWVWGRLPRVDLDEILPEARDVEVKILRAFDRTAGTSLNLDELTNLLALVRGARASYVLEVGTFDGNTALNIAANVLEDGSVTTIDRTSLSTWSLSMDATTVTTCASTRKMHCVTSSRMD